jgi:hypothetical protein
MPNELYDPFDTGSQKSESQRDAEDHLPLPEPDEPETYALGKPIELPELSPPPRPVIEPLEAKQNEASADTSLQQAVRRERAKKEYPLVGDSVVSAMWYPLSGQRFRVLGLFTVLFWLCPFVPIGRMIIVLIASSYAGLLLLETAAYTLDRNESGLRFPDISIDNLQSGMYALSVVVIAELPLIIMGMMIAGSDLSPLEKIFLNFGCIFFVMYYVPMGLIAVAQIEDVSALNPLVVFRGIGKIWRMYFILVTTTILPFVTAYLLLNLLGVHWAFVTLVCGFLLVYSLVALIRAVAIVFRDQGIDLAQIK